jgi:hypothetical protein
VQTLSHHTARGSIKGLSIILITLVVVVLHACVAARPGVVPSKLQAAVGQPFSSTEFSKPTVLSRTRLPDEDGKQRYQETWKNGCSYVVVVDERSQRVSAWYYLSAATPCESIGHTALGS